MDICIAFAPVIALVVSLLKRVPFLAKNPKIVAFVLSLAVMGYQTFAHHVSVDIPSLVQCVLTQFAGSVATYEVAKTVVNASKPSTT